MNQPNAQENDAGDESDHSTTVPTSSMSIDDPPVNVDNNLAVNDEPDAVPSGSSGSLRMNYDTGECAICMGPHEDKSRLNCGHFFCFQCLVEWVSCQVGMPHLSATICRCCSPERRISPARRSYTPDPLPVPITNDPATMIRVLMYNGEWGLFNPEIQNQLRTNDEEDFRRYMEEVLSILNPVTQPRINDEPNPNDPSEDLD
uniref:RING-type domain-containing protein n=1 Tax=Daphnia galeata TaxID=27404 RepID=A0A8J2RLW3_9CRUS|nr:unnamed protein product [Daphnia galeata]